MLNAQTLADLAIFAARFAVLPSEVYVLPALFERSAEKVGMAPRALIAEATYRNVPLGRYMAEAAKKVAAADKEAAQ